MESDESLVEKYLSSSLVQFSHATFRLSTLFISALALHHARKPLHHETAPNTPVCHGYTVSGPREHSRVVKNTQTTVQLKDVHAIEMKEWMSYLKCDFEF